MTWEKLDRSGVPIVDRRGGAPDGPSPADIASNEADRQARRHGIRLKIAELTILKEKAELLRQEIRRLDGEVEAAADEHSQVCQPLQLELAELEQAAISRIASREPADKKSDVRRAAIIAEIQQHNEVLEEATTRCKRLKSPLEAEVNKLLYDSAALDSLQGKLTSLPLACPKLLARSYVCERRIASASARITTARKNIGLYQWNLDGQRAGTVGGEQSIQLFHISCCEAELAAAQDEQAAALAESQEVYQQKLDE